MEYSVKKKVSLVQDDINEMVEILNRLEEKEIRWNPTEKEWSIMQIAVHVSEAIPFWLHEIEKIKKNPDDKWGRDLSHEGRLYAVSEENIQRTQVEDAIQGLKEIPSLVEATLSSLTEGQLEIVAPSKNPNFNGKNIQFIIDSLVVKHINGHVGQMKRNLSKMTR